MGMAGFAITLAPAIGPTLAGYILEHFRWEMLFYGIIPFALIVIVSGFIFLRNVSERIYDKVDFISVVLSTVGFGALIYGFSRAAARVGPTRKFLCLLLRASLLLYCLLGGSSFPKIRFSISREPRSSIFLNPLVSTKTKRLNP